MPHNALLSRLAIDLPAATRLSRGRTLAGGSAALIVGAGLHWLGGPATIAWLLGSLSLAAVLGGAALLPLLVRMSPGPVRLDRGMPRDLPWRFLSGSVAGMVALAALGKGAMHLPPMWHSPDAGTMLAAGRTVTALLPLAMPDLRRGPRLLAGLYAAAGCVVAAALLVLAGLTGARVRGATGG